MPLRTLATANPDSKTVLVRVDFNVPIDNGVVQDVTRLKESLATIQYLLDRKCKLVLMSHLGRPKGQQDNEFTLKPVAAALEKLLGKPVAFANDCIGQDAKDQIRALAPGTVILLENLRFHAEEEANDPEFAKQLCLGSELFVNDAFGTAHRAHASTEGVTHFLPSYAGLLMEKEVTILDRILNSTEKPLALIVGGAKVDTKIGILEKFVSVADTFILGGALANTFLKAQGHEIGSSLYEPEKLIAAKNFLEKTGQKKVVLPIDCVCTTGDLSENSPSEILSLDQIRAENKILDIGPQTLASISAALNYAKTVIWNGPMGLYEFSAFADGTRSIAKILADAPIQSILGGGDTVDAIHKFGFHDSQFTHVSTGGGAMLEFLEGKILPGVAAVQA